MRRAEGAPLALWRTTVFRFVTVTCAVVTAGVVALLGLIYRQASVDLDARADRLASLQLNELLPSTPDDLPDRVTRLTRNVGPNTHAALFSEEGALVAGDAVLGPIALRPDGVPRDVPEGPGHPPMRALAVHTRWGETLAVGRDATSLLQVRAIVLHALIASGLLIAVLGLAAASLLSVSPLRRLRELEAAGRLIAAGRLDLRMPVSRRRDELDLFAGVVNAMVSEIERLLNEVRSTTDAVAHDLRTPLTRVRARLYRLLHGGEAPASMKEALESATDDLDQVLERFTALLRISELESLVRRAGFGSVDLGALVKEAAELYGPLAEEKEVRLTLLPSISATVEGDGRLLFEALSNLLDNAIKFSPVGGEVEIGLSACASGPMLTLRDAGPGVAPGEREAVLRRFYRGSRAPSAPGFGLGLSLVAAILRLHHFGLRLESAGPGLMVVVDCWPHGLAYEGTGSR